MNRRYFLQSLIATGLVAAVDTDRLLWIPGEKRIFVPRFTEWQRAQWLTFLKNREAWLTWFNDAKWEPELKADILRHIAAGEARARELGLDEKLHRFRTRRIEAGDSVIL